MNLRPLLCATTLLASTSALAAAPGAPAAIGNGFTLDPIVEGRMRFEQVETPALDAEALTVRLRAGAELRHDSGLALLAEAEGSLAVVDRYNAYAFVIADRQRRPGHAVVADPMTVEVNRLQLGYRTGPVAVTLGRQRINLDDQRFVGSVGWRQNEQTFDALRAEAKLGPVRIDGSYAVAQRTILGASAGPRQTYDGSFVFLGAGAAQGPFQAKAFAYLLDYDRSEQLGPLAIANADIRTFGLRLAGTVPLGQAQLALAASYARQSGWQENPTRRGNAYIAAEAALSHDGLTATAGFERLGGNGISAFQTPMATLHKFNGWADQFLVTPAAGLGDVYAGLAYAFGRGGALPGLKAAVTFHRFASDRGGLHYGDEWDASLGLPLGRMQLVAKLADYRAERYGSDTRKFWLQVEFAY